jgi:hypothetical protein
LNWLGIHAGRLGVKLDGERLPFRWKSGAERTFSATQFVPAIQPGTVVTLRNAGDDPLILYRLTLMPGKAGAPSVATPREATPQPS